MTDDAIYEPLPTPHGRVRPSSPPLQIQEGSLPPELVEQARARHAVAEALVLPRAMESYQRHVDPEAVAYLDFDLVAVRTLQRAGASIDFLTEDPRIIAEFGAWDWIDFAVGVSSGVASNTMFAIARYLVGRVRKARQAGHQPQLDLVVAILPDARFVHATGSGSDAEAVLKGFFGALATVTADPAATEMLLRLVAKADPSVPLSTDAGGSDPQAEALDSDPPKHGHGS